MRFFDVPVIGGSAEQQLSQIRDFLYLQTETLNYNLSQQEPQQVFQAAKEALSTADSKAAGAQAKANYQAFRDLIIGTADVALHESDTFQRVLREVYHAESQIGTFTEMITTQMNATARSVETLYTYYGEVLTAAAGAADAANAAATYITKQQNFIKTGYLENGADVFGIDVGLLSQSYSENGTTVAVTSPKKIRITPDRLSFYDGSSEVAYLSQGAIYFPNAQITGGTIQIGQKFSVTNTGQLTATGGTFNGNITGGSIVIGENFGVTSTGLMTASQAVLEDDTWINGWYIGDNEILTKAGGNSLVAGIGQYFLKAGELFEIKTTGQNAVFNGMYVNGVQRISSSGTGIFAALQIGATQRIDGSGNATFNSVTVGNYGIDNSGAGTFNGVSGGTGTFDSLTVGSYGINSSGAGTFNGVSGGAISGSSGTFTGALSGQSLTVNGTQRINSSGDGTFNALTANSLSLSTFDFTTSLSNYSYYNYGNFEMPNGKIRIGGLLIQWGKIEIQVDNTGTAATLNSSVLYQESYKSNPMVYVTTDGSNPHQYISGAKSEYTDRVTVYLRSPQTYRTKIGVHWMAVGEAAS